MNESEIKNLPANDNKQRINKKPKNKFNLNDTLDLQINISHKDIEDAKSSILKQIDKVKDVKENENIPETTMRAFDDVIDTMKDIYKLITESTSELQTAIHLDFWYIMQPTIQGIVSNVIQLSRAQNGNKLLESAKDFDALIGMPSIPSTTIKRAETIEYPLDKINSKIWSLFDDTNKKIAFAAEKRGSKKELNIYYSIDFEALGDEISITKKLLPFDKRVYIAISALFNAGNKIITLTQIYYAIGNTGRPSASSLDKINNSITKMMGAKISVNNEQEASQYRYSKFVYDGALLPIERGSAIINGQLAESAIHIFREPPVISFAKQRSQVTTLELKVLKSPVSKTDLNLLIDDYLIERISKAKNGKGHHRILYKTIYEKAGITSKKQKERTPDKVKRYLDHYQKCGMISHYSMRKDGVSVYF